MDKETSNKASAQPANKPTAPEATNGLAVAAMVVGILSLLLGWFIWLGLVLGILGIVLGTLGLKHRGGRGMAITGIVTGILGSLFNLLIIFVALAGLALFGGIASEVGKAVNNYNQEQQTKIDAQKDFSKGETGVFDNFEVKVNSVTRNYQPDNEFSQAAEGKELIAVNLTVKNITEESQYVSPYSFVLNEGGLSVSPNIFASLEPELSSGNLSAGASITGNVVFEVAAGAENLKLQHETTVYDSKNLESKTLTYTLEI